MVIRARQHRCRLAILGDMNDLVECALETTGTGRIHGHGYQAGTHATEKCAKHLQPRRVGKQQPILRRKAAFLQQVLGDGPRPLVKRSVGIAFEGDSVEIKVRIQELVWVLSP